MYAAAGGASIASRRKQKKLQLHNRRGAEGTVPTLPARIKIVPPAASASSSSHHHHSGKFARAHNVPQSSSSSARLPPPPPPSSSQPSKTSSHAFHSNIEHHRHRRRGGVEKFQHLAPPVSPIIQFPISPPPLSLESPDPFVKSNNNNFPFPPPSFLDLRVSPSSSELQCGGGPGKAAWQGCNRPPFPLSPISPHICRGEGYNKNKQCEAHRRWMKRNRIRDASYCYGSSGDEDDEDGSNNRRRGEVNAAVNTVLYAGLGTTALGLVISFVGTGEKGFLSPELKLVGPSLLCAGLLCCLFRVLLCLCRVSADKRKEKARKGRSNGPLPTALLLLPITQQQSQQHQHQSNQQHHHHHQQLHQAPKHPARSATSSTTKAHELLLSPAQLPE